MMAEPSDGGDRQEPSVRLQATVETPWGAKQCSVPMDTGVQELVNAIVRGCGKDPGDDRYDLEVPFGGDDDGPMYERVPGSERTADALRGVVRRPQIVPKPREDMNHDNDT